MNPVELNTLIAYLTNYLFCKLEKRDFLKLALFLAHLSKEMLEMEAMRNVCLKDCKGGGDSLT
jgi:hypothetical protein